MTLPRPIPAKSGVTHSTSSTAFSRSHPASASASVNSTSGESESPISGAIGPRSSLPMSFGVIGCSIRRGGRMVTRCPVHICPRLAFACLRTAGICPGFNGASARIGRLAAFHPLPDGAMAMLGQRLAVGEITRLRCGMKDHLDPAPARECEDIPEALAEGHLAPPGIETGGKTGARMIADRDRLDGKRRALSFFPEG